MKIALIVPLSIAMQFSTAAQSVTLLADLASGRTACPLPRVALVRGPDSEASEGGGFYAARKKGIHGAVDLNGTLGETVQAIANVRVVVASKTDWGLLGRTVILDHQEGGYSVYGHLDTVVVTVGSFVSAGQKIGTMGYSGNAAALKTKGHPPHLHFAYLRALSGLVDGTAFPLNRIRESGEGISKYFVEDNVLAGLLHPMWAVKSRICWRTTDESSPSTLPPTSLTSVP